ADFSKLDGTVAGDSKKSALNSLKNSFGDWWTNHQAVRASAEKGEKEAALTGARKGRAARENVVKTAGDLSDVNNIDVTSSLSTAKKQHEEAGGTILLFVFVSFGVGIGFSLLILAQLNSSISAVIRGLSASSEQVGATSNEVAQSSTKLSQATAEQS